MHEINDTFGGTFAHPPLYPQNLQPTLEGVLVKQESMKLGVCVLREMMKARRYEIELEERQKATLSATATIRRHHREPRGGFDLEDDEVGHEGLSDEDDDDARSIGTVVPHELEQTEEEDEEQLTRKPLLRHRQSVATMTRIETKKENHTGMRSAVLTLPNARRRHLTPKLRPPTSPRPLPTPSTSSYASEDRDPPPLPKRRPLLPSSPPISLSSLEQVALAKPTPPIQFVSTAVFHSWMFDPAVITTSLPRRDHLDSPPSLPPPTHPDRRSPSPFHFPPFLFLDAGLTSLDAKLSSIDSQTSNFTSDLGRLDSGLGKLDAGIEKLDAGSEKLNGVQSTVGVVQQQQQTLREQQLAQAKQQWDLQISDGSGNKARRCINSRYRPFNSKFNSNLAVWLGANGDFGKKMSSGLVMPPSPRSLSADSNRGSRVRRRRSSQPIQSVAAASSLPDATSSSSSSSSLRGWSRTQSKSADSHGSRRRHGRDSGNIDTDTDITLASEDSNTTKVGSSSASEIVAFASAVKEGGKNTGSTGSQGPNELKQRGNQNLNLMNLQTAADMGVAYEVFMYQLKGYLLSIAFGSLHVTQSIVPQMDEKL
ncbi:hypothetical protein BDN72DRAFT_864318 [Pluteus cervinus]|uniref:Uncharacterized protein n=1 Tax=Pluteus cervinus TaxID=181527 RepID=A0ACD3A439_9AGAR|nr:hypothetical protein BDN72DRAFT_864318 [Pluteus cervinus]